MYQTLYRKYRPLTFDEVYGQFVIIKTLKNAIMNNKLNHAYLFTGPRGTGKTSVAKILAKTINCENVNNAILCNNCVCCTQNNNNPIDILEIDAASNNGVEEIRELKSKINLVPSLGKYKVYIIDEVHMLSIGAFNALLKTLEEPPKHVIFILATTDPHKLPSTILSRCQRFDFKKINVEEMVNRMKYIVSKEKIEITDEALNEIAFLADGGMRDALSLLDQSIAYSVDKIKLSDIHEINGTITKKEIAEFMEEMLNNDIEKVFNKIDKYNMNGKDFIKLAEEIIEFLRNVMLKINVPILYKENNMQELSKSLISKIDNNILLEYIKEFNIGIGEMKKSNNSKILFELIIIKLIDFKPKEIEKNISNIINENNIKNIRINNTLCYFDKKLLLAFKNNINELKKYLSEEKYSKIISLVLDGELKAIGKTNMIFVFENNKLSDMFNDEIVVIEELFSEVFKEKFKVISVDGEEWEKIKIEFNNKNKKYKYINE